MSERDTGSEPPSLGRQLKFFCDKLGIGIRALEERLQLPPGALKQHVDVEEEGDAIDEGLAGVLRISYPELDWVPGSPKFPGPNWEPRFDPNVAAEDGPRTDTERRILKIWRRVLKSDTMGIHDEFADLGGHSLHAQKIIGRIYDVFDLRLPMEIAVHGRTVAALSKIVDRALRASQTVIFNVTASGEIEED